jgi:hypothetical protein
MMAGRITSVVPEPDFPKRIETERIRTSSTKTEPVKQLTPAEEANLIRAIEVAVVSEIYYWGEQQIKNQPHALAQEISKRTMQYLKGDR